MEKLKMHSPDLVAGNIEKIAALFPNCITEAKDATGKLTRAVDFDLLKQELSGSVVEGPQERYRLDWPGKREALLAANAPIAKTLRPCIKESVNFDKTKNLFIEGDNLDALKLLQETYLGKIKIAYIDPPYNTGKDFIYHDDFSSETEDYLTKSNQVDEIGNRLVENLESNGRFHSDWLNMLYPRLKLCYNLLSPDGVLFVSIDAGESANLRKLLDEVFGAENFVNELVWIKANKPLNTSNSGFSRNTESIFVYSKSGKLDVVNLPLTEEHASTYKNPDNDPRGRWTRVPLFLRTNSNKPKALHTPWDGAQRTEKWFCSQETLNQLWADKRIIVTEKQVYKKIYLSDSEGRRPLNILDSELSGFARNGTEDLRQLDLELDYPKPVMLLNFLLSRIPTVTDDEIVLDFFAGSATTAHSVIELNSKSDLQRRFIMIQLPEPIASGSDKNNTFSPTIADIAKSRIRKCGALAQDSNRLVGKKLDIGFRVLKIDVSNFGDVYYRPDSIHQDRLLISTDNIREDRTPEDLLFQVMLDWGVDLGLPIASEKIAGKTVYFVDGNALAACFDTDISEELVTALAKRRVDDLPLLKVVFRDAGYADDSAKINVEQIFKLLSPTTELRTL